jgi:hypothetical protein
MPDRTRIVHLVEEFQIILNLVCSSPFAGGQYVLGFEPIWFGPTVIVRPLRVRSLFWPIRHHANQRAQSLLEARSATAIKESINTYRARRLTLTRGWHACPPLLYCILSHLSKLIYRFIPGVELVYES